MDHTNATPALYYIPKQPTDRAIPWLVRDENGQFPSELKGIANPFAQIREVPTLAEATAAVIVHNFKRLRLQDVVYIKDAADDAQSAGVPLFVFSNADLTDQLRFDPRVYVLRLSTYRSTLEQQDIVMPTLTEDNGPEDVLIRLHSALPVVSFCGQAGYNNTKQQLKFWLKTWYWLGRSIVETNAPARILGVYWRRKMIAACTRAAQAGLLKTNFIIRHSFSGAARTIELDPEQARQEFIESISDSDFVLAPKGDGNYSNRFLEALSFGRIPILLDTESVLPLEKEINYSACIVRVPMKDVARTPEYVRAWYDAQSEESWRAAQLRAREIFATRLRFDSFFRHFFTQIVPHLPADASTYCP